MTETMIQSAVQWESFSDHQYITRQDMRFFLNRPSELLVLLNRSDKHLGIARTCLVYADRMCYVLPMTPWHFIERIYKHYDIESKARRQKTAKAVLAANFATTRNHPAFVFLDLHFVQMHMACETGGMSFYNFAPFAHSQDKVRHTLCAAGNLSITYTSRDKRVADKLKIAAFTQAFYLKEYGKLYTKRDGASVATEAFTPSLNAD